MTTIQATSHATDGEATARNGTETLEKSLMEAHKEDCAAFAASNRPIGDMTNGLKQTFTAPSTGSVKQVIDRHRAAVARFEAVTDSEPPGGFPKGDPRDVEIDLAIREEYESAIEICRFNRRPGRESTAAEFSMLYQYVNSGTDQTNITGTIDHFWDGHVDESLEVLSAWHQGLLVPAQASDRAVAVNPDPVTPACDDLAGLPGSPVFAYTLPPHLAVAVTDRRFMPLEGYSGPRFYYQRPNDNPPVIGNTVLAILKSGQREVVPWRLEGNQGGAAIMSPCVAGQPQRSADELEVIGTITGLDFIYAHSEASG